MILMTFMTKYSDKLKRNKNHELNINKRYKIFFLTALV